MPDISGHEPILNVKHVSESIHTDPPGFVVLNQLEQLPLPTSNSDVKSYTEYFLESFFRTLLFWETDTKRLGTIIRILHHSFIYVFAVCFIIIHTIMPSFIGLLILFLVYTVIWLQHMLFGRCIVSNLEQSLLGDSKSFIDPFLDIFHIPITQETTIGITTMGSTLLFIFLGFELSARFVLYIKGLFS